ncbi:E3 ubiquitin-protein ligase XIAP-like [Mercenaria mercenaria]|uniref:E3 ubiquitin-protein ligase XIAP-like n=1 Tax=Mercenaria mercenaria TaxID=6596 RepID=UPI00234F55AC|nr:E3 ubiquitin-protein ligase XIAP-like [Mercenaria mercenaria]XP_053396573.1 E3 ubiquitin-protein ligase XIAP-like [Mercenaria mercenaria]XP_053396574.1 E3 ubiquitin-protein ligase XIAP-like [Mercenaria mercenaria]
MAGVYNNDKVPQHESADEGNGERNLNSFSNGQSSSVLKQRSSAVRMSGHQDPHTNTVGTSPRHDQDKQKQRRTATDKLKCPEYRTFADRVSSFINWPVQIKQTPEQMANAGLFFTGFGDCVRCFTCGGKLCQWCPTDDPWTEHCRLFPLCSFARRQKGDHFITQTQEAVNSGNQGDVNFGYSHSNLVEQLEVRMDLEDRRGALLQMGYEDCDFKKVVRHLRNMGVIQPTVEELVDALVALKE